MFDYAITGGVIADGTGAAPYSANLYMQDGKIARITPELLPAAKVFDAKGHIAAPGFIDLHAHSDRLYQDNPTMESKLTNGITFEFTGQCGSSAVPVTALNLTEKNNDGITDIDSYAEDITRRGISVNIGTLIGHGTLRQAVIGNGNRQLTPEGLEKMCGLLGELLDQGAGGVSFGLIYVPGVFCDTAELIAIAKVVASRGKLLAVHMRNENRHVFEALDEMIAVARASGVRLEISHLKLMGQDQWGRAQELLDKIDRARAEGVDIHCDQTPYTSSHTSLYPCFPRYAMDGGFAAFTELLKNDESWAEMSKDGLQEMYDRCSPDRITVDALGGNVLPQCLGHTLTEIADILEMPLLEAFRYMLIRSGGKGGAFYRCMDEGDMLKIMARRDISVISDGNALSFGQKAGTTHPRNFGTACRFLRIVREHKLMPIEDAVRKLTGLPASTLRVDDRFGLLKEGMDATITVFDKDTVTDKATYENPRRQSEGIDLVVVNGQTVLQDGHPTAARPGRFIRL